MSINAPETVDEDFRMKARLGEIGLTEASARFGIPTETLKAAVRRGDLPARREEFNGRRMSFLRPVDVQNFKANIWQPHSYPRHKRQETPPPPSVEIPEIEPTPLQVAEVPAPVVTEPAPAANPLPNWIPATVGVVQIGEVTFLNLLYISVPITDVRRIDWDAETSGVSDNAVRVFTTQHMDGYLLVGKWADTLRNVFNVQRVKAVNT